MKKVRTDDMLRFGKTMHALRKRTGMNIFEAADLLGISAGMVCNYEYGRALPRVDRAIDFARCYGVSVEALYSGEI